MIGCHRKAETGRSVPIQWILLAALILRLGWAIITPAQPVSDFAEYDQVARNLISGHGYSRIPDQPTAYRPPVYPFFLAGIYSISAGSILVARLANAVLGTLAVLFSYLLACQTFSKKVAAWAATIHAFTPSLILYSGLLASENVAIPLLLASMICALRGLVRNHPGWLATSGLILGWTCLARSLFILLPVTWMIWALLRKVALRKIVAAAIWVAVGIVVALLPWIIRNALTFGRFIPLATNSGSMLVYNFNPAIQRRVAPGEQIPGLAEIDAQGLDEPHLDAARRNLAIEFIRQNPFEVVRMIPYKLFYLYRDDVSGVVWSDTNPERPLPPAIRWGLIALAQGYYIVLMLLSLVAVIQYRKLPGDRRWICIALPILYVTFFHTIFFGDDRYHLTVLPFLAIFAGFQASQWWEQITSKADQAALA